MPDQPSPDPLPGPTPSALPPIVGPLADFLEAHPEYREHVVWNEQHQGWGFPGWGFPGWVGNALLKWQAARLNPDGDPRRN